MRGRIVSVLVVLLLASSGCVSLTAREHSQLDRLNAYGISSDAEGTKNPAMAGSRSRSKTTKPTAVRPSSTIS